MTLQRLLAFDASAWIAGLALFGCIDYNPSGKPSDPVGHDSGSPSDSDPADSSGSESSPVTPVEECDGLDNDGDEQVDEGFVDHDSDGVADCVDDACEVPLDREESASDESACTVSVAPSTEPWALTPLWEYSGANCEHAVVADLDQDGVSEIVCGGTDGILQVIDGATGTLEWEGAIMDEHSTGVALGDVNGDGTLEILTFAPDLTVLAIEPDGTPLWQSSALLGGPRWQAASLELADLDADGAPEVVSHRGIIAARDGTEVAVLDTDDGAYWGHEVAIGDLEDDGVVDILAAWKRYAPDGTLIWELPTPGEPDHMLNPVLFQADLDDDAEIAWRSEVTLVFAEPDGTTFHTDPEDMLGLPCAGDVDGDGEMDVVSQDNVSVTASSAAGFRMWTRALMDSSDAYVACTTFDFDLDGAKEVITSDEWFLYILDGRTGDILLEMERGHSLTGGDTPIIADLDGDGSVEIVLTNPLPAEYSGVTMEAWSSLHRDWPPGTRMWPSATWSGTSLLPDGSVPRTPHAPWLTTGVWRGQPETPVFGIDLRPATGDVCVASCAEDGEVRVEVRLQNLGPDEAQVGAPLAVYGVVEAGTRELLEVLLLSDWLDDGRSAASWEVVTNTAQARRGLVFVAGDDGTGALAESDCDTSNNEMEWTLSEDECP